MDESKKCSKCGHNFNIHKNVKFGEKFETYGCVFETEVSGDTMSVKMCGCDFKD